MARKPIVFGEGIFMSHMSGAEEKVLDSMIAASGASLDKFKLRDFAILRAKNAILRKHPDWSDQEKFSKDQMARLVDLNLQLDYENDSVRLIEEFIEFCKSEPAVVEPPAAPEVKISVIEVIEVQKAEEPEVKVPQPIAAKDKDIDKPVSGVVGRRTRLHLACEKGDYDEVVRLIEVCGAKFNIRDSSNWTPQDRARFNNKTEGHARIIEYLEKLNSST